MIRNEHVIQGKDGWLYLDGDSNQVVEQTTGKRLLSDEELSCWDFLLQRRKENLRAVKYIYLCAPNKESVYPGYLPEWYTPSIITPISQLKPIFKKHLDNCFIYPADILNLSKKPTYPKGDTHWNQYGAFLCFQEIAKILNIENTINEIEFTDRPIPGDLGKKLHKDHVEMQPVASFKYNKFEIEFDNKIQNRGKIIIFNNPAAPVKECVVFFRDSFGSQLMPFLVRTYKRVVALWQPNIDLNIISIEKPSVVISEQVERFLIHPPSDEKLLSADELALSKNNQAKTYYND